MDNIPIVDAHHHLWDLENEKTKYSWLMVSEGEAFFGDYGAIRKSYLLDDYLNDAKNQNLIKSVQLVFLQKLKLYTFQKILVTHILIQLLKDLKLGQKNMVIIFQQ